MALALATAFIAWSALSRTDDATDITVTSEPMRHGGIEIATYLGDETRRYYGPEPVPETLRVVWRLEIGSGATRRDRDGALIEWAGTGWTGQAVVVREVGREYLIIAGFDHVVRKVDADSGDVIWTYECDDAIKGTPTIAVNPNPMSSEDTTLVIVGSRRGANADLEDPDIAPVRAISYDTGRELWRVPVPRTTCYSRDADASALVVDGLVYQAVGSGYVYALEPWTVEDFGIHRTPLIRESSRELFTGKDVELHSDVGGNANVAIEGSPALLGDRIYVASGSGHVYGLDREDLSIEWDFEIGSDIDSTVVVTDDGLLLVGVEQQYIAGRGGMYLLDPTRDPEESVVWYAPCEDRGISEWAGGVVGSAAVNDSYDPTGSRPRLVAYNSVDGNMYVVARETLAATTVKGPNLQEGLPTPLLVYKDHIGASISTPIIVGDHIVSAGYDNTVHVYRITYTPYAAGELPPITSRDGTEWSVAIEEVASYTAGDAFESTPIVWGGRIYIGCRDGYFYCLGAS